MPLSGFQGFFNSYPGGTTPGGVQDDEQAIDEAIDNMFSMCGNAGQESIIGRGAGDFWDWAMDALEAEFGHSNYEETIINAVGESAYFGTIEIWSEGYALMADQSGYHDGYDENGEGTGEEFT